MDDTYIDMFIYTADKQYIMVFRFRDHSSYVVAEIVITKFYFDVI